jgi:hypothetical protein
MVAKSSDDDNFSRVLILTPMFDTQKGNIVRKTIQSISRQDVAEYRLSVVLCVSTMVREQNT